MNFDEDILLMVVKKMRWCKEQFCRPLFHDFVFC